MTSDYKGRCLERREDEYCDHCTLLIKTDCVSVEEGTETFIYCLKCSEGRDK
jgi:hypothetical protein